MNIKSLLGIGLVLTLALAVWGAIAGNIALAVLLFVLSAVCLVAIFRQDAAGRAKKSDDH